MAIQPEDFLALAQENLESSHEVHYRNAASRGYYAAYHAARALEHRYDLLEGGGGGTHRAYIGRLQEYRDLSNPDTARSINSVGHILGQMVGTRNMADYEIGKDFDSTHAEQSLLLARKVFEKVKDLLS